MNPILQKTAKALCARGFDAHIAENSEDAARMILSWIPTGESITFGGSATLVQMGIKDLLKQEGRLVYDRSSVPPAERAAYAEAHFFSDWFLMSSNAITEEGELFNMDGIGNRIAALIFGPKNVIVVAGSNKIVPNADAAVTRVRTVAAPRNAQRFDIKTPCKKTGSCADCFSPDTICTSLVRTRYCRPNGRIRVLLVDGEFGF